MKRRRVNIVVAEDNYHTAQILTHQLAKEGYNVVAVFNNGAELLKYVSIGTVDLILIDIFLSGPIDGIETMHEILKKEPIPHIYISISTDKEMTVRAKTTNPVAYVAKPWAEHVLMLTIHLATAKINGVFASEEISDGKASPIVKVESGDIYLKQNYEYLRVEPTDILYLKTVDRLTFVHTEKRRYVLRMSLTDVLEQTALPSLIRINRSCAVNRPAISSFTNVDVTIGCEKFALTKLYKAEFLKQMK